MMDISDLMKMLMGQQTPDDKTVEETWAQVAKLSPEDTGRQRSMLAATAERHREYKMLQKKCTAIKAQVDADADEWWHHIYKVYGLPQGNYHITDDGRIFVEPKEKK